MVLLLDPFISRLFWKSTRHLIVLMEIVSLERCRVRPRINSAVFAGLARIVDDQETALLEDSVAQSSRKAGALKPTCTAFFAKSRFASVLSYSVTGESFSSRIHFLKTWRGDRIDDYSHSESPPAGKNPHCLRGDRFLSEFPGKLPSDVKSYE